MTHASRADLRDIDDLLAAIRSLPGMMERTPGVFYLHRQPFLHFHTRAGDRRAHAKIGRDWGPEIPLPPRPSARVRTAFLREIRRRHRECLLAARPGTKASGSPSLRSRSASLS